MKPRILDLCCCEGGSGSGFHRAGWDVFGVDKDHNRLRNYPFEKHHGDAFEYFRRHWQEFDAVNVSPDCQGYSRGNAGRVTAWPRLIGAFRDLIEPTGLPYVIENVKDAAWDMRNPVTLCGCMFDLSTIDSDGIRIYLQRPRLFETNWGMTPPRECDHSEHEWVAGAYGGARRDKYEAKYERKGGYVPPDKDVVAALLGVEHEMTWKGLFQTVPPKYTEHIGTQLLERVSAEWAS